ncbi:hypothetical protein GCM10022198_07080 [Klugiella xanthotipulae]|uniref:Glycopeptide antibiotics resistance protein n=1 Tax=Klugiella xanthotipulae TaxID=244735 RepID=A0A543HT87_9MICO|nr:VanZ family protein [Klugiella xanthotipulae]TQM61528.1 glycopeptide antibiotics resistance protein [Klugiella xanthotipulae]
MTDPIIPGVLAILFGSMLAVVLLVPFIAISYRRRGVLGFWWLTGWFALVIYVLALWTYTLLPLPSTNGYHCSSIQTVPFASLDDIATYPHGSLGDLIRNPAILQLGFNVALFIPLGFMLRSMFHRGVVVATVGGFLASLFIEITQATGVWGIFPCAYRLFDVDDLITNTMGALLGSLVAMLVVRRRGGVRLRVEDPRPVTAGRRLLGMVCDLLVVTLVGFAVNIVWRAWELYVVDIPIGQLDPRVDTLLLGAVPAALQLVVILATGATIGEHAVMLRGRTGPLPAIIARPLRWGFGIGGYLILTSFEFPGSTLLVGVFVVVTIVSVWAMPSRRGLAAFVSGMTVEDARATHPAAADTAPDSTRSRT